MVQKFHPRGVIWVPSFQPQAGHLSENIWWLSCPVWRCPWVNWSDKTWVDKCPPCPPGRILRPCWSCCIAYIQHSARDKINENPKFQSYKPLHLESFCVKCQAKMINILGKIKTDKQISFWSELPFSSKGCAKYDKIDRRCLPKIQQTKIAVTKI